jgi:hypothetical protein
VKRVEKSISSTNLEAVALLDFIDEIVNHESSANAGNECLDQIIATINIEQAANNSGEAGWVDLLHVDLDVLALVVLVQVDHQIAHKVEAVAHDDEGQLVRQLGLLQEVLDTLGIEKLVLTADTLNLTELASLDGSLDVLEDDLGVLAEVDNGAKEVEETLEGLERLEEIDEGSGGQLLVVLGGNLTGVIQYRKAPILIQPAQQSGGSGECCC